MNIAFLEKVSPHTHDIRMAAGMAKLYGNYTFIKGALMAFSWRVEEALPTQWQKAVGLGVKGKMKDAAWKNKAKAMAQRLYPDQKVTLATADALLILEYAIMKSKGNQ